MSVADKVFKIYGIRRFLEKYDTNCNIEKDRFINPLFVKFAKSISKSDMVVKSNKKNYRGKYQPSLDNSIFISNNFNSFSNWVRENYKLNGNENENT